jgi:hypothetical protein
MAEFNYPKWLGFASQALRTANADLRDVQAALNRGDIRRALVILDEALAESGRSLRAVDAARIERNKNMDAERDRLLGRVA